MLQQSIFQHLNEMCVRFSARAHIRIVLMVLASVTVLLTTQSLSQPLAQGRSKFLGCGTNSSIWSGLPLYWNQVTPGNDGKWGSVEGTQGQFNWTNLDLIYNYTVGRSLPFKEHTLVWGAQQPSWITSLDSAGQREAVRNWIQRVGERYPSMAFVDVVNEPFRNPPSYMNALGGSGTTGWDWVITAFQWARQYSFPGVKLLLNEYNILQDNAFTTNYLRLVDTLRVRNLIDGIGIQGHYFEFRSHIGDPSPYVYDVNVLRGNLDRIAATGLPVYITEFDIDEPIDSNQLAQYKIYFPLFWTHPGVKGMTFWGYIQNDVWSSHPNTFLIRTDGSERPVVPWLRRYVATPFPPTLVSPVGTSGVPRNPLLVWRFAATTISYRFQVATNLGFSSIVVDSTIADTLCRLNPLAANTRYYWRVSASNDSGTSVNSATAFFITGDQIVDVEESAESPVDFALYQNYPNPFNPTTRIEYSVPEKGYVSLKVYNLLGQEVATLFAGVQQRGNYSATFDGAGLASGVYLCRLHTGNYVQTRKLVLQK